MIELLFFIGIFIAIGAVGFAWEMFKESNTYRKFVDWAERGAREYDRRNGDDIL